LFLAVFADDHKPVAAAGHVVLSASFEVGPVNFAVPAFLSRCRLKDVGPFSGLAAN
jgi:hypothetical protein